MGVDHLGDIGQEFAKLWRAIRRASKATLQNASIGRGGIRVYEGGAIRFEDGGGIVILNSGYITIDGDITGAGDFTWTGPWEFTGPGEISGDVTWTGDVTASGQWDLTGDMIVRSGGEITIQGPGGNVTLSSSYSAPRIQLGNTVVEGSATVLTIAAGTSAIYVGNGKIRMTLAPRVGTGLPPGTVGADLDGTLWRAS